MSMDFAVCRNDRMNLNGNSGRHPYAEHVKEFLTMYDDFNFEITELISEDDKVYARWIQKGKHLTGIEGYAPTGKELTEMASAVYRLEYNRIFEYWIQIDRFGFEKQLQQNK